MPGSLAQGSPSSELQGTIGTCQICGSAIAPRYTIPAVSRWGSDSDFHVYWCRDCDAGFLLPRPSPELLESFYTSQYFADYGKGTASEQSVLDRLRVHLAWQFDYSDVLDGNLIEAITNSRTAKVCDLGCGNGTFLAKLRAHGFQVVGIEPSPFARKEVESNGIKVYEGTAESLPNSISESPFDLVVMTHVLEHCLDLKRTIKNALELVRPGGHVVIEVPNCASFQFATRGPAWFHFDVGRHVNYFTPRALAKLIENHGAGAQTVRYYYRKYVDYFLQGTIKDELSLWDRTHQDDIGKSLADIRRPSRLENWMSLLTSFHLEPTRKYEAVIIVIRKT
jgi:SAM-dependent methyltransferase